MSFSAQLIWKTPDGDEQTFPLREPVATVGRDEQSDVQLEEPLVSRNHARIERREGVFYVQDVASTNWTRVNGEVVAEQPLADGDELRFGRAVCVFRLVAAPPAGD